jgi:hypothetical protein
MLLFIATSENLLALSRLEGNAVEQDVGSTRNGIGAIVIGIRIQAQVSGLCSVLSKAKPLQPYPGH